MANNSNVIPEATANAQFSALVAANPDLQNAIQQAQTGPQIQQDVTSQIDPRKVYLAKQTGNFASLNPIEQDFAQNSIKKKNRW